MLGEVVPQSSVLPGRPDLPPRAHSAHMRGLGNGKHNWGRGFQCGEGTSTPQPSSWPQIRPCTAARPPNPSGSSRSPSLTPSPLSTPPTLSRYPTPRRTLTIPPPRLRHKSLTPLHSHHVVQNANRLDDRDQLGDSAQAGGVEGTVPPRRQYSVQPLNVLADGLLQPVEGLLLDGHRGGVRPHKKSKMGINRVHQVVQQRAGAPVDGKGVLAGWPAPRRDVVVQGRLLHDVQIV